MTDSLTTVFVYGTLMPGERNGHVARLGGHFTARPATLHGYELFHLRPEAYPVIRPAANPAPRAHSRVSGFALTYSAPDWARALPFLDDLEGVDETPPLYTRERVVLRVAHPEHGSGQTDRPPGSSPPPDGADQPAWVYVYARTDRLLGEGVEAVPGGDWRTVPGRQRPEGSDR